MEGKEIVRKLVVGQQNLDLMKREIYMVVNLFIGLLRYERSCWDKDDTFVFESEATRWQLWVVESTSLNPEFALGCDLKLGKGSVSAFAINWNHIEMRLNQIEKVYDELPTFIDGIIQTFPGVADRIKPILKAAERRF